jgi:hypothetical protein
MAKRPPRTQADDLSTSVPPGAKAKARPAVQRKVGTAGVHGSAPDERPETIFRHLNDAQQSPGDDAAAGDAPSARGDQQARTSEPADEDIRRRAYQMYLERGGGHGEDLDDWVRAEQELKTKP